MPLTDLPLPELETYRCQTAEPTDFDAFWQRSVTQPDGPAAVPVFTSHASMLRTVDVADVTFAGFGGAPVRGWLLTPAGARDPLPCVVEIPGYGGGRGLPHESLVYSAAGYAHLVMDLRGQGAHWLVGATPDPDAAPDPHFPGFMTSGVLDPDRYYYRRVIVDALRAIEAVASHPLVDAERICVMGGSAGAGVALAAVGLGARVQGLIADVPYLCDIRRGCDIASKGPYLEVVGYLRARRELIEPVMRTLSYFDGVFFARRATVPALFSVALMDPTCPPSTGFAAINDYGGPTDVKAWEFNEHEGGEGFQQLRRLAFLERTLCG
jgi:cephalosporin-C deacetylase